MSIKSSKYVSQLRKLGCKIMAELCRMDGTIYAYLCEIPLDLCRDDATYQRTTSRTQVYKLRQRWMDEACDPLAVSLRDNWLWVFNGNHRRAAAIEEEIVSLYAFVHVGLTENQEAKLFYELNDAPRRMSGWTAFKSAYNAGSSIHRQLIDIADKYRLTTPISPGISRCCDADIKSPTYLLDPYRRGGFKLTDSVCKVLDRCWRVDNTRRTDLEEGAKDTALIRGLAVFLKETQLPWNRLELTLRSNRPDYVRELAKKRKTKRTDLRQYCEALCEVFGVSDRLYQPSGARKAA